MIRSGLFCLLFFLSPCLFAQDAVESLIEKEQEARRAWTEENEEAFDLPPVILIGTNDTIQLYAASTSRGQGNGVCEPDAFDELIDLSHGSKKKDRVTLNLAFPRVRERLGQACLIRPGDPVWAVGKGWTQVVAVQDFVVMRDPPVCPTDSAYSLNASFDDPLPDSLLFFSTNSEMKEGDNGFLSRDQLDTVKPDEALWRWLRSKLDYSNEYRIEVVRLSASNVEQLIVARKKRVSPNDVGLPNELILWRRGDDGGVLVSERVEKDRQSGHVRLNGVFDFNLDGILDLLIRGDQYGCPYQLLYQGLKSGFQEIPFPNRPCSC